MPDLEPVSGDPFAERFTGEPGKLPVEGPYFDPTKMPDWWARKLGPLRKWPGEGIDLDYGEPNPDPVLPPQGYSLPYNPNSPYERGKFTPVGTFDLQPVNGDPFASMTHQPQEPAQPYMHQNVPAAANAIAGFATGGLQGAGVSLPDWAASNPVQRTLQSDAANTALGVMTPLKGTSVLMPRGYRGSRFGAPEAQKLKEAENTNDPRQQFIDEYDALIRKKAAEFNRESFHVVPVDHDPFVEK